MITITEKEFNAIPQDYRCIWTNEKYPEYIGKRACIETYITNKPSSALVIEDFHFKIKK